MQACSSTSGFGVGLFQLLSGDIDTLRRIGVSIQQYSASAMLFKLITNNGQPLYLQLKDQVRHGIENGTLRHGDQLPGIRTLAQELLVSPATVVKAYAELEHEGVLTLRQGLGAFIRVTASSSEKDRVHQAKKRIRRLLEDLREAGLRDDEIRRIFEAELLLAAGEVTTR